MQSNTRLGIWLMIATTFVFSMQDGISRYLASHYNVFMVVMIRYWFFAAFVMVLARRSKGSIRAAAATTQPLLQIFRGVLLAAEICVMVVAFVKLGLVESHAIFAAYPLLVAALSGPVLGESVGWRRWAAIGVGFIGVLVILEPGIAVFSPVAIIPMMSALMFALYGLLTRYAARKDSAATSFFWTGVSGDDAPARRTHGVGTLFALSQFDGHVRHYCGRISVLRRDRLRRACALSGTGADREMLRRRRS